MQLSKKIFLSVLFLEIFVHFSGIAIPFFSNDPALYAAISKTMVQRNDFIGLYVYGMDWLDKPHFPFWMAAISFKMFGISEWAYRLPALLFILIGALYTYRLARKLYGVDVARIAVLVLLSAQHLLMSNTDVRAEPYLLGLIVASVYHFHLLQQRFSWRGILLGSLFAGCAVMTKGIFALVPIGSAILGHAVFSGQLKKLFQWRWVMAILLTIIFVLPEIYAVYLQFDLHPEKPVFGKTGVSGIKWFLWDSQFGRFTMQGPITRAKGDVFYYVHTLLWAFAPWCLVFYFAIGKRVSDAVRKRSQPEYITLSAIVPMLLFFSLSQFQLNFYTNILFPFFSVVVASFIAGAVTDAQRKLYSASQIFYSSVFLIGLVLINLLFAPAFQWLYFVGILIVVFLLTLAYIRNPPVNLRWLLVSGVSVLFVNFYLNCTVYPTMSALKGEIQAARFINASYPERQLGVFYNTRNGFEFYSRQPVQRVEMQHWISGAEKQRVFYVDHNIYNELVSKGAIFRVIKEFNDYSSESISGKFIKADTRHQTLHKGYLIESLR